MNKRIARKILLKNERSNYWSTWYNQKTNVSLAIPKSGKHWYLILRAADTLGQVARDGVTEYLKEVDDVLYET